MAKPVSIPNSFATSTSAIPLSYLDQDFNALANSTNDLATYSNYVADTGSANAYIANFPANTNTSSLTSGLRVQFKAANANTGTSTLNVQVNSVSIGSATIKLTDGSNLPAGAIVAGALVDVMYDGTNFQLLSDSSGGAEVITNLTVSGNATVAGTTTLTGNLAVDTNVLFVDTANNNVGIGTSSPSDKVSVSQDQNAQSNIVISNQNAGSSAKSAVRLSSYGGYWDIANGSIANNVNSLTFGNAGSERMRIDSSGNVFVAGTSGPVLGNEKFGVYGSGGFKTSSTTALGLWNTSNEGLISFYTGAGTDAGSISGSGSALTIRGGTNLNLSATGANIITLNTNSNERMRIDSSGNVGIGTSSPSGLLHVFGNVNSNVVARIQNSNSGGTANAFLVLQNNVGEGAIFVPSSAGGNALVIRTDSSLTGGIFLDTFASAPILFRTNGANERMRIDSSGNVGIGTSSPSNLLHVSAATQADDNGLIKAENTTAGVANASFIAKNYYGTSQFMQWESTGLRIGTRTTANGGAGAVVFTSGADTERMRIDSSGNVLVGKTSVNAAIAGVQLEADGGTAITRASNPVLYVNRNTNDGTLVEFRQDNTTEGTISVSGTTVSYNAFAGSHWSQLHDGSKPEILRGTVLESINELCEWPDEPTSERLCRVKVSDTAGSKKVYGVFMDWDNDWTATNDMMVTSLGAFVCRVAADVTVEQGDLLESNGDGTARVQSDDVIRSSTIGKVTSTVKTHEYNDGTYCVPTVLYCG